MSIEKQTQLATLFKALMHPARLAILEILRHGEECVCHMEARLGVRQAYVSQQLALLREAGLIEDRRDGWNIFYRVTRPEVFVLIDLAREMVGESADHGQPDEALEGCPCPKCTIALSKAAS